MDKKESAAIIEVLKNSDKDFYKKDNVQYATKAFVINSVVKWVLKKYDDGFYKEKEVEFYVEVINKFINDEINLFWDTNGDLQIESVQSEKE
tara:strand:- start:194 stop:469 length:276 start_codon:yes stop_codon:yes gene_type:complete